MKDLYNFTKDKFIFTCKITEYDKSHPDGERYTFKVKLNNNLLAKNIEWFKKDSTQMYLGYIGFEKKFQRKGILKNYIHPHCVNYMKKLNIEKITLKPLTTALLVWLKLDFKFSIIYEEKRVKFTILNYLKSKGIISEKEILLLDKKEINEIVKMYRFDNDFPKYVENNSYYTFLEKAI